ncbi:MAG: dihydroxy-acid dehydratase, partial [Endomicrobiia bacterium]
IDIDIINRTINVKLSDEEIKNRFKSWKKPEPKIKKGWLNRYSRMVTSASTGAVLK